jgi:hypothetical protein
MRSTDHGDTIVVHALATASGVGIAGDYWRVAMVVTA